MVVFGIRRVARDAHRLSVDREVARQIIGNCCQYRLSDKFDELDLTEENIAFNVRLNDDDTEWIERKGLLIRRPHAQAVVLICHGFMCNKDDARFLRGALFPRYSSLIFDFRAHGECTGGQFCTFGMLEKEDVRGAVEFIRNDPELADKPLIVYGFSMGAVASLLAQSEYGDLFDAAVWDCPFDSTDKVFERLLSELTISIGGYELGFPGRSLLHKYAYNPYVQDFIKKALKTIANLDSSVVNTMIMPVNTVEAARKITIPSFFIVCKKDAKAPVSAVYDVYKNVQGARQLWVTNGRYHFDSFFYNPERYIHSVNHFIEDFLSGKFEDENIDKIVVDEPSDAALNKLLKGNNEQ